MTRHRRPTLSTPDTWADIVGCHIDVILSADIAHDILSLDSSES